MTLTGKQWQFLVTVPVSTCTPPVMLEAEERQRQRETEICAYKSSESWKGKYFWRETPSEQMPHWAEQPCHRSCLGWYNKDIHRPKEESENRNGSVSIVSLFPIEGPHLLSWGKSLHDFKQIEEQINKFYFVKNLAWGPISNISKN